jgi:hypothetical protein
MSRFNYEALLADLEWLKKYHPSRKTLISFVDKFQSFVTDEHQKMRANVTDKVEVTHEDQAVSV